MSDSDIIQPNDLADVPAASNQGHLNSPAHGLFGNIMDDPKTQPTEWPADEPKTPERLIEEQNEQQLLFEAFKKVSAIIFTQKQEIAEDNFIALVV